MFVHYHQTYQEKQSQLLNQISDILDTQTTCTNAQKTDAAFSILQKIQLAFSIHGNEMMEKTINLKPTRYSKH